MKPPESVAVLVRRKLSSSNYLRDILWQISGNSAAQILGIAIMPVLTRLYAPDEFAALTLFTQIVAGLTIFMTMRLEYLVMLPPDQRESDAILFLITRIGFFQLILWTPILAAMPSYWDWLKAQEPISTWLWLAPLSAWSLSLAVGLQQAIQRNADFRTSAGSEFVSRCSYVACTLIGALALPNIIGLMGSIIASSAAKIAWIAHRTGKPTKFFRRPSMLSVAPHIRRMSLSTSLSGLVSLFSGIAPMVFIADRYGANALGQYGLVVSTLYLPTTLLGQAIGQVYYQRAAKIYSSGDSFSSLMRSTSSYLLMIGVPLYGSISLLSPLAYPFIFGDAWVVAGEVATWLCIAAGIGFFSTPLDKTSLIVDAWWYLMAWHLSRAITTTLILIIGKELEVTFLSFVAMLSCQTAVMYGIDLIASFMFSKTIASSTQKKQPHPLAEN